MSRGLQSFQVTLEIILLNVKNYFPVSFFSTFFTWKQILFYFFNAEIFCCPGYPLGCFLFQLNYIRDYKVWIFRDHKSVLTETEKIYFATINISSKKNHSNI